MVDRETAQALKVEIALAMSQTALVTPLVFGSVAGTDAAEGSGELVLVVGATGGIGQFACYDLLQRGYRV